MKTSLLNASALSLALTIGLAPAILAPAAHAQDTRTPATQDQQRQRRAQTEPGAEPRTGSNTTIAEEGSIPIPPETKSETKHDWTGGGHTIHYTATAGNLLIRDENDKANGSIFYVAYTEDGAPAKSRPVTFLYNGGPGSATIWLHMGSVGPIRVVTKSPEATGPAPFEWVQNEYSLLDKTDLVFIDAPLCGFSRAVGKGTAKDFAGVDQDVKAFEKFITRYITVNQRWGSPKFLFGESYGTPRSAALVAALNNDGIEFNGVTLLSSILNYYVQSPGYDLSATTYLPSYAAIAWHYNKVPHNGDMKDFVQQAREFARGPYATALQQGDQLPPAEFDAIAAKVAAFTGLSVQYVKESKLRISATHFRKELMRGDEQILGRYDARFEGYDVDSAGENPGYDPSDTGISGVFVGAFHDYLASELKYTSSEPYYLQGPGINQNWDWHHRPSGSGFGRGGGGAADQPDTVLDLADAMRKNPHLHVFSANGWFDLATPFFGTEHDLAQMMLPPSIAKNVEFGYYPAGHMVYLNVEALKEMHADLERFYGEATAH
ncbi:MAG TPA: peptidase S10 [Acidobacteriaceae bacterium]